VTSPQRFLSRLFFFVLAASIHCILPPQTRARRRSHASTESPELWLFLQTHRALCNCTGDSSAGVHAWPGHSKCLRRFWLLQLPAQQCLFFSLFLAIFDVFNCTNSITITLPALIVHRALLYYSNCIFTELSFSLFIVSHRFIAMSRQKTS
jgi:hypothetical protein